MDVQACSQHRRAALLVSGAGVAALLLGLGYKYLRKPEKVVRVGVVSQLLIHPIKSGKAVSVAAAQCQKKGLKFGELEDRHWLVITDEGQMVTGRQEPRLVLVSLTCEDGQVCLNGPDMEELRFPFKESDKLVMDCRVFGADIQGRDCGDEASRWLTRYFGAEKTFRLVHFETQMRPRKSADMEALFSQNERVAYADVGPVMLLSESSVKDLSSRLDEDVTVERFRPNIVISDCDAFEEDSWDELQIGSVRLQRVMSCGRYRLCNPSEKHIYKSAPLFGQLHTVKKTGVLQVGDVVYKISR
ncbi:Mitochondrial amidoxime-reducing component 1 [Nibea albiflora]|uniref:Mitochondrial amidoxime-reducing component 1 n=1 Tax=Nibea albiflora TaxID=240163 RepID=A0ACB7FJ41_NIBAL|nr:Mitochondrial amidoxime-reducing component 1 [Nibea albiflora]